MFRATTLALVAMAATACNTPTPVFDRDGGSDAPIPTTTPIDGRSPDVAPPTFTSLDQSCTNAMTGPFEESLPVPQVQVEEDDGSVHLRWFSGDGTPDLAAVAPTNYEGVRVCWGTSLTALNHATLFTGRRGQLLGISNGQPYVAIVQSVDALGRISRPSTMLSFTGSRARVDRLRREMTGFFDDFNLSAGALDGRLWNVAYSRNDPTASGTFISQYQHAVSMLSVDSQLPGARRTADRTQNVARPRAVFDFTGREGRIVFDLDGTEGGRHTWYLDIFPYSGPGDVLDITAHPTFDPGPGYPGRFLRIAQSGPVMVIHQHAPNGDPIHEVRGEINRDIGSSQFMRHFEIRVSRNRAAIYIDGEMVLENRDIRLDFERSFMHWAQFGYNLIKMDRPWSTMMWDNFGFDGPPTPGRILNYQVAFNGVDHLNLGGRWNPPTYERTGRVEVAIPDSLAGATSARLFYTLDEYLSDPSSQDQLVVNGQAFPLPEPPTQYRPYATSIPIPVGLLRQGNNTVQATLASGVLANVHIEVEFPSGPEPAYTQPAEALGRSPLLTLPPMGPDAYIQSIDDGINGPWNYYRETVTEFVNGSEDQPPIVNWRTPVRGTVRVNVGAHLFRAMAGFRQNLGIARVELLVDGMVAASMDTNAAVPSPEIGAGPHNPTQPFQSAVNLMVDTTRFANGAHQFEARAYDSMGNYGRLLSQYTTPIINVTISN